LPGTVETPYLVHTNWELPLLLEGRKKLAHFSDFYPSPLFDCEKAFDRWVANGVLHKEVVDEPLEKPTERWLRHRAVYYTPKGEEWRIPAHKLFQHASGKSGGWNEHFERLEGMLFGYEDWQNDWWIKYLLERGSAFGGATYCCAVTAAGLAWTESTGLRALPPIETYLPVMAHRRNASSADLSGFLREQPGAVAILRFTAAPYAIRHIIDLGDSGPWQVPGHQVATSVAQDKNPEGRITATFYQAQGAAQRSKVLGAFKVDPEAPIHIEADRLVEVFATVPSRRCSAATSLCSTATSCSARPP